MAKSQITNKFYLAVLLFLVLGNLTGGVYSVITEPDLKSSLPFLASFLTLFFLITKSQYLKSAVKVVSGLTFLMSVMSAFLLITYLIAVLYFDKHQPEALFMLAPVFICGICLYLFLGADKHILTFDSADR
jgi:predicted membrane protein